MEEVERCVLGFSGLGILSSEPERDKADWERWAGLRRGPRWEINLDLNRSIKKKKTDIRKQKIYQVVQEIL